jgi:hypothetical protein
MSEDGRDDLAIAKLSEVIDGCSLEEAGSVLLANAYFEVRARVDFFLARRPLLPDACACARGENSISSASPLTHLCLQRGYSVMMIDLNNAISACLSPISPQRPF